MTRLTCLVAAGLAIGAVGVRTRALQEDACARLTRMEAATVLGVAIGEGRVAVRDLAFECSYEAAADANRRLVLTLSVYETGRAGLRGSAASYFADVRRASIHMGLSMRSLEIGDEAYWLGGVLHVRKGQDVSFAIEVNDAAPDAAKDANAERYLAISMKAAAMVLGRLDAPASTRETLTIATNTQAHRKDLRIAVGNIWEESYTPDGGTARVGLTAMLDIGVPQDASPGQRVRVHPGQTLRVFGYVLQIVSIERSGVRLTLARESPPRER